MKRGIVFGGGGVKGLLYLGVLKWMEENNIIFKYCGGSSIGAIFATICCLELKYEYLYELLKIQDVVNKKEINIMNLITIYGIDKGISLKKFLYTMVKDITFKELYEKNKKILIITGLNLTKKETEYFSVDNTPNMKILDALLISTSLPFLFGCKYYNNDCYTDGAIGDDTPYKELKKYTKDITIITITGEKNERPTKIKSLVDFLKAILEFTYGNTPIEIPKNYKMICLETNRKNTDVYDYKELLDEFIASGYTQIINKELDGNI